VAMTNYKAKNPKPLLLLCRCEEPCPYVIARSRVPMSLRGAVSLCHCEERSDEAISVGGHRLPRTLWVLAMTGRRNAEK
jgi:hypothetical protein